MPGFLNRGTWDRVSHPATTPRSASRQAGAYAGGRECAQEGHLGQTFPFPLLQNLGRPSRSAHKSRAAGPAPKLSMLVLPYRVSRHDASAARVHVGAYPTEYRKQPPEEGLRQDVRRGRGAYWQQVDSPREQVNIPTRWTDARRSQKRVPGNASEYRLPMCECAARQCPLPIYRLRQQLRRIVRPGRGLPTGESHPAAASTTPCRPRRPCPERPSPPNKKGFPPAGSKGPSKRPRCS